MTRKPPPRFDAAAKARTAKRNSPPVPVNAPRAPLPRTMYGPFIMIECAELVAYTLHCLIPSPNVPGTFDKATFAVDEDELKTVLTDFGLDEVSRIVSAARYSRKVQVIPNRDNDYPQQIISLYPQAPKDRLEWPDHGDNQPVHELPRAGYRF